MMEAVKAAMTAAASSARASAATTSSDRQIRASTSPSSKVGAVIESMFGIRIRCESLFQKT
jgi:hypothetical protein